MTAELWIGLLTLIIGAPPSYYVIYQGVRKGRAEEADRIDQRIEVAKEQGRQEATQMQLVQRLTEQVAELRSELDGGVPE